MAGGICNSHFSHFENSVRSLKQFIVRFYCMGKIDIYCHKIESCTSDTVGARPEQWDAPRTWLSHYQNHPICHHDDRRFLLILLGILGDRLK